MNERIVRKMAEVQAFVGLAIEILEKSNSDFADQFNDIADTLHSFKDYKMYAITNKSLEAVFYAKRQKTTDKLTKMMELYVGDSWDNPIEILEWLSFYAGSAASHAALARGALEAIHDQANYEVSTQLSDAFWQLLESVKKSLFEAGAKLA